MNDKPAGGSSTSPNASSGTPWWQTVSPQELRGAAAAVERVLQGSGPLKAEEVEAFARALALRQLFGEGRAFEDAASAARGTTEQIRLPGRSEDALAAAEAWLPRGKGIEAGLNRCLKLLQPREDRQWVGQLSSYHMTLYLLEDACFKAACHGGTRADLIVTKTVKFKPRKV